jgi:hypothetical protein
MGRKIDQMWTQSHPFSNSTAKRYTCKKTLSPSSTHNNYFLRLILLPVGFESTKLA